MSFRIYPPSVPSQSLSSASLRSMVAGVAAVHLGFDRANRSEPWNSLPPDFVRALTTPPVKRPYSADTLLTVVVVSWMASSM